MNFINKLTYNPLAAPQEPQPEVIPQPADSQLQFNTGIANAPDTFVTVKPLDLFTMMQQQTASPVHDPLLSSPEQTVDASELFNNVADLQGLQEPADPESPEWGFGKMVEDFAESKNSKEFGLVKQEAKDATQRLTDAVSQGQKTHNDIKSATDDDWFRES